MKQFLTYALFMLIIAIGLWLIPYGIGYGVNARIKNSQIPFNVHHLVIGPNHITADKLVIKTPGYDFELSKISLTYAPWRWVFEKPTINQVHINELTIHEARNKTPQKTKPQANKNWMSLINIKSIQIDTVKVFDQVIGRFDAEWLSEDKNHVLNLKLVNKITTTAQIKVPNNHAPIELTLNALDLKLQGWLQKTDQGWLLTSKEFGQNYPKGILIQHEQEQIKIINPLKKDQLVGLFDKNNSYLHWSTDIASVDYTDDSKQMNLNLISQFWRLNLKHANKQLNGTLHFNQYPIFGHLINGEAVFKQGQAQALTGSLNIDAFKHPDQFKIKGHWTLKDKHLTGNVQYRKDQNEYLTIDLAVEDDQLYLTEKGKVLNNDTYAKQKVKWSSDQLTVHWLSTQIGQTTWRALSNTTFVEDFKGRHLTQTCFTDSQSQKMCFGANFPFKFDQSTVYFNYKNTQPVDFDAFSPDVALLYDLKFQGGISVLYRASMPMPQVKFDVEDIRFKLDPVAYIDLPIKATIRIDRGEGNVEMDHHGKWVYQMHLSEANGGTVDFNDQQPHFMQARSMLSGIREQSHLLIDMDADWNQQKSLMHFDVRVKDGFIQIHDYFDSISNPIYVYHKMLPIWMSFNIKNEKPITVDILGLSGQVDIDLDLQEESSIWLADGKIKMLPGGKYRKWQPVSIKDAQVMFYKSNLMNPFIQLSLEKRQTLLSNETNISTYKDQILGVRFYGQFNQYQMQTYSIPAGVSDFVILQTVLLNPMLFAPDKSGAKKINLASALADSFKTITNVLPIDQIYLQPAKQTTSIVDNRSENSSVSIMKRLSRSLGMYARFGSFPQDNIFSIIFRPTKRSFGTQLYSNYQSQGINLVFSH